jgi:hypothetical protein
MDPLVPVGSTETKGGCRAYFSGTHGRKDEDGLLLGLVPCNPTMTHAL